MFAGCVFETADVGLVKGMVKKIDPWKIKASRVSANSFQKHGYVCTRSFWFEE